MDGVAVGNCRHSDSSYGSLTRYMRNATFSLGVQRAG